MQASKMFLTRALTMFTFHQRNIWKVPWKKPDYGSFDVVLPGFVSSPKTVPDRIVKPVYHQSTVPVDPPSFPEVKSQADINKMRRSCQLARKILNSVRDYIQVGQTTDEIDIFVHELTIANNAYPSPLNYRGFPKSVCTSVNNVACHGIPDDRPLQDGDIINIDITVYLDGFHGDCSKTYPVGNVDSAGLALIKATEHCLNEAINICRPGVAFCHIGSTIESTAKKAGYTVVPVFVGHGIGSYFHGPPDIYHCENDYPGQMQSGMTFTIEPVLSQGTEEIVILEDGWTAVTADNSRTAQAEHTILVTDTGVEVLTEY